MDGVTKWRTSGVDEMLEEIAIATGKIGVSRTKRILNVCMR